MLAKALADSGKWYTVVNYAKSLFLSASMNKLLSGVQNLNMAVHLNGIDVQ
jgi:hypothetical protein